MRALISNRLWVLAPALIGLVGVVIGFAGNAWWQNHREAGRQAAETRQAVRLVGAEMEQNSDALWMLDVHRSTLPESLSTAVWRRERGVLARNLPEAEWHAIEWLYSDVEQFQSDVLDQPYAELSDDQLAGIRETRLDGDKLMLRLGVIPAPEPKRWFQRRVPYRPDPVMSSVWWPAFVRHYSPLLFPSTGQREALGQR